LEKAAHGAGEMAASPHNGLPASAQAPLQSAQQALAKATAAAAGNNPAAAMANATAAQAALAQAHAASAMAAGPHPGQGPAGQEPGTEPGQGPPSPGGDGSGNFSKQAQDGAVKDVTGRSAFIGLPARDRQAIKQSQGEKYPEEYGAMIEQYLLNLAEQSSRGH